jgi:hypothetical protein
VTTTKEGRSRRRRGHDWERELVRLLCDHGFDAVRVQTESRHGNIGDVLIRDMHILVQCKAGKQPNLATALDQAEDAAGRRAQGWTPIGAIKKTTGAGDPAVKRVSIDLTYFIELLIAARSTSHSVVVEDDLDSLDSAEADLPLDDARAA